MKTRRIEIMNFNIFDPFKFDIFITIDLIFLLSIFSRLETRIWSGLNWAVLKLYMAFIKS